MILRCKPPLALFLISSCLSFTPYSAAAASKHSCQQFVKPNPVDPRLRAEIRSLLDQNAIAIVPASELDASPGLLTEMLNYEDALLQRLWQRAQDDLAWSYRTYQLQDFELRNLEFIRTRKARRNNLRLHLNRADGGPTLAQTKKLIGQGIGLILTSSAVRKLTVRQLLSLLEVRSEAHIELIVDDNRWSPKDLRKLLMAGMHLTIAESANSGTLADIATIKRGFDISKKWGSLTYFIDEYYQPIANYWQFFRTSSTILKFQFDHRKAQSALKEVAAFIKKDNIGKLFMKSIAIDFGAYSPEKEDIIHSRTLVSSDYHFHYGRGWHLDPKKPWLYSQWKSNPVWF